VQVTKDPVGHKGARLTSQISLPGRYLVYVPGASMTGISRKLPDTERNRLKQILKKVMPENAGVIVRTAAEGAAEEELSRDVSRLAAQWEAIEKKSKTASSPAMLYGEPDLTIRVIRDVFNEDFSKLVVSGEEAWDVVDEYVRYVAPHLADRVTRWQGDRDAFAEYRIDEQLAKALERKVWLPSGGSLVIDKTEAMTVVDVNTGKFTGQGGNLEETVTRNNLEAAEEIVRQLRLRDVGGIVVIDFIDMVLESNRELVLRRLLECLSRDRTKHQVAEVTSLGLVQMTRKRVGAGLLEAFSTPCECCNGPRRHPHLRSRLRRPGHPAHALSRPRQWRSRQRRPRQWRSRQWRPRTQPGPGRRPRPLRRVLCARRALGRRPRRRAPRGHHRRPGLGPGLGPGPGRQRRPERRPGGQRPGPGRRARARALQRPPPPPQARRRYRPGHPADASASPAPARPNTTPAAPDTAPDPAPADAPEVSAVPEASATEASQPATVPVSQDGADGMPATHDGVA
jgi:ribonuclease E